MRKVIDGYEADGAASLKPKERGRSQGDGRRLSPTQEAQIRKLICENRPEQIAQLKLAFALWTRGAVRELIAQECKVALKIRAVGNYLKRWGFTPQKPIRKAYEQKPEAVKAWLVANLGLAPQNIQTAGEGSRKMVVLSGTVEEQAPNRRVEIIIRRKKR